ncbi:hypothetical protein [Taibaiella koreensis]|uniref:hypothetical protein n=1 Tax=Taibaiella koreensis TaxID=1268548 RepID=UPI000E59A4D5|nr:hypothetical protein [Taibaiella koreensis]
MKVPKTGVLLLFIWIAISLYFGLSGLCKLYIEEQVKALDAKKEILQKVEIDRSIDGRPSLKNQYDYQYYMLIANYQKIFPLVYIIPGFLGLVFTAMFFGMIGAVVNILVRIVGNEYTSGTEVKYVSEPILGLFTGLCVLGISYVLPTLLVSESDTIRPITLMFFALFSGLYARKFFEKMSALFPTFFKQ